MRSQTTVSFPDEWEDQTTEAYMLLHERVAKDEMDELHDFFAKNPIPNVIRCLKDGSTMQHSVNKIKYYSQKQKKGDFFASSRNLPQLYLSDIKRPERLLIKIKVASDDSFSGYLRSLFSDKMKLALDAYDGLKATRQIRKMLVGELNSLMQSISLYNDSFFDFASLPDETQFFVINATEGEDLYRLNRLLLEHAYSEIVKMKKRPIIYNKSIFEIEPSSVDWQSPLDVILEQEEMEMLDVIFSKTLERLRRRLDNGF